MSLSRSEQESERLAALHRYRILDTPSTPDFDAITELAAYICQAPMALVSFVDSERQWFKSEFGLGRRETPVEMSFCAHAVRQPDLFIVADTMTDSRFNQNPLVIGEPGLRFYAGSPLTTSDGHALGTLCILDKRPRELRDDQKRALGALSRQAMSLIELHLASLAKAEMLQELQRAAEEKALLLRELEHRVKNNLQLVTSVLNLQSRHEGSEAVRQALDSFGRRLRELAIITGQLQGSDVGEIDLGRYLKKLIEALVGLHALQPDAIQVEVSLTPLVVPVTIATPLGLIVNEFVTNSFKHAFRNGRGALRVELARQDAENFVLRLADDGPGLPPAVRSGLGTQIIPALARQIGGRASYETTTGCCLKVEIRL